MTAIRYALLLLASLALSAMHSPALANGPMVIINEIAWMGGPGAAHDEWIELHNTTDAVISLSGWRLESFDGKLKIPLEQGIPSKGFYLLERTDDASAAPAADVTYKGILANSGMHLVLYDVQGNLIDQAPYASGWPAGDNAAKQTMERIDLGRWQTSAGPGGTPKAENSRLAAISTSLKGVNSFPGGGNVKDMRSSRTLPNDKKSATNDSGIKEAGTAAAQSASQFVLAREGQNGARKNPWTEFWFFGAVTASAALLVGAMQLIKKHVRT